MTEKRHPVYRVVFWCSRAIFRAMPMSKGTRNAARAFVVRRFGRWLGHTADRPEIEPGNSSRQHRTRADEPAIGHIHSAQTPLPTCLPARLVVFYQTQFGPADNPSTDLWRFTVGALPQFEGHHQPRLPGELGYYNPNCLSLLRQQASLAARCGIEAFCFHIHGTRCDKRVFSLLREWMDEKSIDRRFFLCWNPPLLPTTAKQEPNLSLADAPAVVLDDLAFIASITPCLQHPKFLRIDDKPVLVVRDPMALPDPGSTAARWRHWCNEHGIGSIHLIGSSTDMSFDPQACGFDAAIQLPCRDADSIPNLADRQHLLNPDFRGVVHDWRTLAHMATQTTPNAIARHPVVLTGLDDEPIHPGRSHILLYASPRAYRQWLSETVRDQVINALPEHRLVFIDAWNDWPRGAVLEPDARLGYAWLDATLQALQTQQRPRSPGRPCALIHAWYPDVFAEILQSLKESAMGWRIVVTTTNERLQAIQDVADQSSLPIEITSWPNHGRDILPFLQVAERLLLDGEDVILKLHTKRSPHLANGEQWRREMIASLMAEQRAQRIFAAFQQNPHLGLVGPEGHLLNLIENMGVNERNVSSLLRRAGYLDDIQNDDSFIAGSMFWMRLSALEPLLNTHLSPSLFETEAGQVDGTLAHAIERCIGVLARQTGFEQTDAARLLGESPRSSEFTLHAHHPQ